jgi:predicted NBD/HSP70 family sugar kinase
MASSTRETRADEAHWSRPLRRPPWSGRPDARGRVAAQEAAIVARALAAIVAVVDPELIVLGGGIGRAPGFAEEVRTRLAELAPIVPEVRPSALGPDAVVDGCLAVGGDQLWERVLSSRVA